MRARRWIIAGLGIALLLLVPGVAAASPGSGSQAAATLRATGAKASGGPRMLAYNASSEFVRRPATVVPFGNGAAISTIVGRLTATRGTPIHWRTWGKTAYGRGTMWENDMTPSIAEGHWSGHAATLYAHRVVHGRYTRLTLRDRENGKAQVSSLRLVKQSYTYAGKSVYAWRTFVRVPSWRDFPSAYTGSDWETSLRTLQAAIERGFAKRGLIADVEYRSGYDGTRASQRPKASSRVETGTIVHIHIPVWD